VSEQPIPSATRQRWLGRIIQLVATTGLWFGSLCGGAGRLDWPRGWIYAVAYLASMAAIAVVVRRRNPGLSGATTIPSALTACCRPSIFRPYRFVRHPMYDGAILLPGRL